MKKRSSISVLFSLLSLVRPLRFWMLLAIAAGTLGFLCAQFITILGGSLTLSLLGFPLSVPLIVMPVLALSRAVLRYTEQRTNHYIAFTLLALVRDQVFGALRRLCPAKLAGRDKGDLVALITADVELLEVFYAHTISPVCIAVLTETVMCLYIGRFHPLLGLYALLAFLCIGLLVPLHLARKTAPSGAALREKSAGLSALMLENLRGLDETLQFGQGHARRTQMQDRTRELSDEQGVLSRLTGQGQALTASLILFLDAGMLFLAHSLYRRGLVGFDGLLLSLLALMSSFGPVTALSNLAAQLPPTIAAGARILDLLEESPETPDITGQTEISYTGAALSHVDFSYLNTPVLENVSLAVPDRGILALVGPSGSGKSTILRLLMRFWQVQKGSVLISGKNVNQINTDNLRAMQSFMTQDAALFSQSIADNVRIGRLNATQEEIEAACKKASIHDFIQSLPKGYDTPVGELGDTLSGGERQRLELARAFLHDAPLLLLDEPTSNLDSLNEAVILRSIKEDSDRRAVLLVTHRRSTARIADRIVTQTAAQ